MRNFIDLAAKLDNRRKVDIYLPPDYENSPKTRYKVLYVNDGQEMPAFGLKSTLEKLYRDKEIDPLIVVAIHATHDRLKEYGVAGIPNAHGLGSKANLYARFLTKKVVPYIKRNYRTQRGAPNTAIMGLSLGGLSAFDIAWRHPYLFGKVGIFSGSFWWRTDDSSVEAKINSRIIHKIVRESVKREGLKMWFEAGTEDETSDRDGDGIIDAIQDTKELVDELEKIGYKRDSEIVYLEVEGGQHNPETWGKVLPDFLKWAFPR